MTEKIPKCYVYNDIVQIRIPFQRNITLISQDYTKEGILCHYDLNSDSQNINKYLIDERRRQFPYSNIPMYKGVIWDIFEDTEEIYYVNEILEFNKHYISITDDFCIIDRYILRDGDEALIFTRRIYMLKVLKERETNRKEIQSEFDGKVLTCINRKGEYINFKKDFKKFYDSFGGLLVIDDNGEIKFKVIELIVRGHYCFKKEYDIPFNDYKIEELKSFETKIKTLKEPRIWLRYNPNIERKDIREAKKLVRKLNK